MKPWRKWICSQYNLNVSTVPISHIRYPQKFPNTIRSEINVRKHSLEHQIEHHSYEMLSLH